MHAKKNDTLSKQTSKTSLDVRKKKRKKKMFALAGLLAICVYAVMVYVQGDRVRGAECGGDSGIECVADDPAPPAPPPPQPQMVDDDEHAAEEEPEVTDSDQRDYCRFMKTKAELESNERLMDAWILLLESVEEHLDDGLRARKKEMEKEQRVNRIIIPLVSELTEKLPHRDVDCSLVDMDDLDELDEALAERDRRESMTAQIVRRDAMEAKYARDLAEFPPFDILTPFNYPLPSELEEDDPSDDLDKDEDKDAEDRHAVFVVDFVNGTDLRRDDPHVEVEQEGQAQVQEQEQEEVEEEEPEEDQEQHQEQEEEQEQGDGHGHGIIQVE